MSRGTGGQNKLLNTTCDLKLHIGLISQLPIKRLFLVFPSQIQPDTSVDNREKSRGGAKGGATISLILLIMYITHKLVEDGPFMNAATQIDWRICLYIIFTYGKWGLNPVK